MPAGTWLWSSKNSTSCCGAGGRYFRDGNSSRQFNAIDRYVHQRLAKLASVKHGISGRNWTTRFNLRMAHQHGDLSADRNGALLGCACLTTNDVGEPCAGEPHARLCVLKGEW